MSDMLLKHWRFPLSMQIRFSICASTLLSSSLLAQSGLAVHSSSLLEHLFFFFSKWLYLILGMTTFTSGNVLCARRDCLSDVVSQHLVNLFARLANDNIGYVDWTPYIPTVSH